MRLCSEFYITSAAWLLHLLDSCASEYQVKSSYGFRRGMRGFTCRRRSVLTKERETKRKRVEFI